MKKMVILTLLLSATLFGDLTLTQEQERNWQIKTATPKEVTHIPLGEYMMSVTTPAKLLHTISLPYEATITTLNKVNFESVKKGELLAELSSPSWIEAQKEMIDNYIELMHNENEAQRKSKLYKEQIIAQKETFLADMEVKKSKLKLASSKTLLKTYGADDEKIKILLRDLVILPTIELRSPIKGVLLEVNIKSGTNISPSNSLFVIKADGENSLDSELPKHFANKLSRSQDVIITIDGKEIRSKVLLLSNSLNPTNQSRYVRFSLNKESDLLAGLRTKATLFIEKKALMINKKALLQDEKGSFVFIKEEQRYRTIRVDLISENDQVCYLEYNKDLENQIAISANSILQNMLQQGEE
jgi:cobalt-zinc-cadmium efflux system membrane fusion protein